MKCVVSLTVCFTLAFLAAASIATADVPTVMQYQGYLTDAEGEPLNDTLSMTFTIYDAPHEGAAWWTETQPEVAVNNGLFNVLLGSVNPIEDTVFAETERWLGITVAPDPEIVPRTRLVTVPYAFRAATVDGATGGLISGDIFQADSEGDTICELSGFGTGGGFIGTYGPNGNLNAGLTVLAGYPNNGAFGVLNANGAWRASMYADPTDDVGYIDNYGPNGSVNVRLWNALADDNAGAVSVADAAGAYRGHFLVTDDSAGVAKLLGPNGNMNVWATYLLDDHNNGWVAVYDNGGDAQAGMYVDLAGDGIVWGDFVGLKAENPKQPGTDIWYCALEGPEAAAYVRGTGHLVSGSAQVALPDHFVTVASSQGITVQVTPLSAESKGLAVVEKSSEMFAVRELNNGNGSYDFDFMVLAVRKGHEDYQVIRPALEMQPAKAAVADDESDIRLMKKF
jgi:hypothetical protein